MTVVVERIYRTRAEMQKPEASTRPPVPVDRLIESFETTQQAGVRQSLAPLRSHTWFSPENYRRAAKWCAAAVALSGSEKKSTAAWQGMQFLIAAVVDCYHNDRALCAATHLPGNPAPQRLSEIPAQIQREDGVYTRRDNPLVWSPNTPMEAADRVADLVAGGMDDIPDQFLVATYLRHVYYDPIIFAQYGNWVVKVTEWE